jgi:hypothetical protein
LSNVYLTGSFSDKVDFDPGKGPTLLKSLGKSDIFVVKLRADGKFIWARQTGGRKYDGGIDIAPGDDGSIYISGYISDVADVDPDPTKRLTLQRSMKEISTASTRRSLSQSSTPTARSSGPSSFTAARTSGSGR